jgi:hypothetical protein
VTLSDELEEEETHAQYQKFLAVEDQKDSQSYYFEHSVEDGEELKETYKVLYVEFLKLRETLKQHSHELNSLKIEKSSLLVTFNPIAHFLKLRDRRPRRSCQDKLHSSLDL